MRNVKVAHGKASRGTQHTTESRLQQKTSSACTKWLRASVSVLSLNNIHSIFLRHGPLVEALYNENCLALIKFKTTSSTKRFAYFSRFFVTHTRKENLSVFNKNSF